ncbi:MAG: uracil-DNA glycosylase family protein [Nitrospira sp.]
MGLQSDYAKLADEIRACTKCGLCTTRHLVVVDRGDPSAELVFIGEAPGESEDASGQAFVGRAGAELDRLLSEAGIGKFLIINVLKCRPPRNKFPGDQDSIHPVSVVDDCLPWLDAQLNLVRPKVIILVGGKAAGHTIYRGRPMPRVGDIVGKRMRSQDYPDVEIFGMYHTSYLLRLKNMRRDEYDRERDRTLEMLRSAKKVLDGESPGGSPVHVSRLNDKGDQLSFF